MQKLHTAYRHILIAVFFIAIWIPSVFGLINANKNTKIDKEIEFPNFDLHRKTLKKFFPKFNDYFMHNFGFRDNLIKGYSFILLKYLHTSPDKQVIIGKNGWLFYDGKEGFNFIDKLEWQHFSEQIFN